MHRASASLPAVPADVHIRPLEPGDIPAADAIGWAALGVQIPEEHRPKDDELRRRRAHLRIAWLQQTDPGGALVAEAGGEVIGFILAIMREGLWGLSLFAMAPAHQGRGVGRKLLDAALAYGTGSHGAIILSSPDPRAMRRYARAGFALLPCVAAGGAVNRALLPGGLHSAPAELSAVAERCDEVSRAVRGAAHGEDLGKLLAIGGELLVLGDDGFAVHRDGSPFLLAARDPLVAQDLLWSCLAAAPPGTSVHVDFVTAGNDWAVQAALSAGLALSLEGPVFVRGDVGPLAPYLPNGAYL